MLMVLMLMMMFTLCFMWPQAGDLQCPPLLGVCLKISAEVSQMGKHLQNPPNNIYAQFGDKLQREIRRQAFDKCDSFGGGLNLRTGPKDYKNPKLTNI